MITAKEAYVIANPMFETYVRFLDKSIRKSAKKGENSVVVREHPYRGWLYSEEKLEDRDAKKAISLLRKNGFYLSFHYGELGIPDIGLKISWEKSE